MFTSQSHSTTPVAPANSRAPADRVGFGFAFFGVLTCALALAIVGAFAVTVDRWTPLTGFVGVLIMVNALWISGGAATAILGLLSPKPTKDTLPANWQPRGQTAILVALCGEDPEPLATYLASFTTSLQAAGLDGKTQVFVISDTSGETAINRETDALSGLIARGHIAYRRRGENTGKKPGNIADWLRSCGESYDYMVVKDADSRMSANSIGHLIWELEQRPNTGLLQAGISLIPGRTRFGRYQRISSRLLGRNFGRGFAAWSGKAGNYWGHNAIMRVEAFRQAAALPVLSGKAPFGGALLSHDFVEAAWMRRAGWDIELAPDMRGSAEDAPQTLGEFFRRDRRWCQGNLQHLRIVTAPDLHPLSRLHLITGIASYLSAPIWLLLVVLLSLGTITVTSYWSIALVAVILLVPKFCALIELMPLARTWARRRIFLRAWVSEFVVSVLVGPLISLRHAKSVCAILLGFDCGWKSKTRPNWQFPAGWPEAAVGLSILGLAMSSGTIGLLWLAPIIFPLIIAPVLIPVLNEAP